jgi:3,4-dihydroxy 2-butanone 4-phosphate synthase/GTP cyclohydrolase II
MRQVAKAGEGVIVVLRNRDRVEDLLGRFKALSPRVKAEEGIPTRPKDRSELRTYGIGAQILADIGVRKMRVMSAPRPMHGISGFDLEVVDYVGSDAGQLLP